MSEQVILSHYVVDYDGTVVPREYAIAVALNSTIMVIEREILLNHPNSHICVHKVAFQENELNMV